MRQLRNLSEHDSLLAGGEVAAPGRRKGKTRPSASTDPDSLAGGSGVGRQGSRGHAVAPPTARNGPNSEPCVWFPTYRARACAGFPLWPAVAHPRGGPCGDGRPRRTDAPPTAKSELCHFFRIHDNVVPTKRNVICGRWISRSNLIISDNHQGTRTAGDAILRDFAGYV